MTSEKMDELLQHLRSARPAASVEVTGQDLDDVVSGFCDRYVVDRKRSHWWESLKVPTTTVSYADDGLALLTRLLDRWPTSYLIVTDDMPPSLAFAGPSGGWRELLESVGFFEFVVVDVTLEEFVFDTHHNALVTNVRGDGWMPGPG